MPLRTLAPHHSRTVHSVLQERHKPHPISHGKILTMVCMDTRPGDPNCEHLANDHDLDLVRHPAGLSGAGRRASTAWATDDPKGYKERSLAAHKNGLRLVKPLARLGIWALIHVGCKDNKLAVKTATKVADKDRGVFEVAQEMDHSLDWREYARIGDGQAIALEAGHIALDDVILEDYAAEDAAIARLHGDELPGISLVDNHSNRTIKPMPKRHTPDHDDKAIYVTDTGLVIPRLAVAAHEVLSDQIRPSTVANVDTIHKATLVDMLDLPYVTVLK